MQVIYSFADVLVYLVAVVNSHTSWSGYMESLALLFLNPGLDPRLGMQQELLLNTNCGSKFGSLKMEEANTCTSEEDRFSFLLFPHMIQLNLLYLISNISVNPNNLSCVFHRT